MEELLDGLTATERADLALRALYRRHGYDQYRMSKFEEYDLYARFRDFLASEQVLSFTGPDGRLLALKPDVTLSIVRNTRDGEGVRKLYYSEKVYRVTERGGPFRELSQVGLECLGALDGDALREVLLLAAESLKLLSGDWRLSLSQPDLPAELMARAGIPPERRAQAMDFLARKNPHGLARLCADCGADPEALLTLLRCSGELRETLDTLRALGCGKEQIDELERILAPLEARGLGDKLRLDFSAAGNLNYYNGLLFRGYVAGAPAPVLSGGRYDRLMARMGRRDRAVGFAVYLDLLDRLPESGVTP